jgi:hypothetical protein
VDTYIRLTNGKKIWHALQAQYGVSDTGSELYAMEQFLDYRMVKDHEIHTLAKDLKNCSK